MFRRDRGEIIESLVYSGRETGCGNVMAEDSLVCHTREETRLRNEVVDQVRDVLLAFRGKGFLITRAAAKGDYDHLSLLPSRFSPKKGAGAHERGPQCQTGCST